MMLTTDRLRSAYETAKAALLAEMVSEPVSADDPVQKLLDAPVSEMRHWVGELSTSALSTATAVMALEQMRRQYVSAGRDVPETWTRLIRGSIEWLIAHQNEDGGWGDTVKSLSNISTTMLCHAVLVATSDKPCLPLPLGEGGGGGEGPSSIGSPNSDRLNTVPQEADLSATPSVDRVPHPAVGHPLPGGVGAGSRAAGAAQAFIDRAGGVPALIARYGKDRTFSVPILTHCALAGLIDWDEVISLPFELACIPARFYAAVRLPVVSYALPALISIGQVRFHFRPSWNPLRRWLQRWAKPASLRVLERIQPPNGGFLEATPLTSFVTMSLAAMGLHDHPVAVRGIEFIVASAVGVPPLGGDLNADTNHEPPEGGTPTAWPIDTNLATWVTTLSINALGDDVPLDARPDLRAWLLRQQYRVVHPYTNAAPGGWAWTDLPGGVPDADDTPGAVLALVNLQSVPLPGNRGADQVIRLGEVGARGVHVATRWLVELQNRDGGWPTFCRGWGALPFDRSSPDITAHCVRSCQRLLVDLNYFATSIRGVPAGDGLPLIKSQVRNSINRGVCFLKSSQRPDGSWLPLWFGNQHAPNDENPTYGTAKVLAAFQALGRMSDESAVRGVRWLVENQNPDGGWGAGLGTPSSVEETALALEALLGTASEIAMPESQASGGCQPPGSSAASDDVERYAQSTVGLTPPARLGVGLSRGLSWLILRVEDGRFREPSPIGFYFAKLWYFEALYPLIFTVAALRKAIGVLPDSDSIEPTA